MPVVFVTHHESLSRRDRAVMAFRVTDTLCAAARVAPDRVQLFFRNPPCDTPDCTAKSGILRQSTPERLDRA
jgi:hypothetical protein